METKRVFIKDQHGKEIKESRALPWGNNASWLCTRCGELLGNRTGDTEYQVQCTNKRCDARYEIERTQNKTGRLHLGAAVGVRKIR